MNSPPKAFFQYLNQLIEVAFLTGVAFLPISKAMVEIGIVTALLLWLLKKLLLRESFPKPQPFFTAYVLFLAAVLISLTQVPSSDFKLGFRGLLKWIEYLGIFFFCAEYTADSRRLKKLLWVFSASMLLVTVNGYYQILTGRDFLRGYSIHIPGRILRMKSSLGAPNTFASFFFYMIPLCFYAIHSHRKSLPRLAFYILCLVFFSGAFILTFSRAALGALVLMFFLYALIKNSKKGVVALLFFLTIFFLSSNTLRWNFLESLNLQDITTQERIQSWKTAWGFIQRHPLTGNGVNRYHKLLSSTLQEKEKITYPHNCYLQMWAEIGLFGLLAFLFPVLWIFKKEWIRKGDKKNDPLKDTFLIASGAFLFQSFFDTHLYALQPATLFWVFWGCLVGLHLQTRSEAPPKGHPATPHSIFLEIPPNS